VANSGTVLTWADVWHVLRELPGTEEGRLHDIPAVRVRGKLVAYLVRLATVRPDELRELLTDAWRLVAPKRLVRELDGRASSG